VTDDLVERVARAIAASVATLPDRWENWSDRDCDSAARAAIAAMQDGQRVKHKKRGTTYVVVDKATLQYSGRLDDMTPMIVYRSEDDGRLWVRSEKDFNDGRFEKIDAALAHCAGGSPLNTLHLYHLRDTPSAVQIDLRVEDGRAYLRMPGASDPLSDFIVTEGYPIRIYVLLHDGMVTIETVRKSVPLAEDKPNGSI